MLWLRQLPLPPPSSTLYEWLSYIYQGERDAHQKFRQVHDCRCAIVLTDGGDDDVKDPRAHCSLVFMPAVNNNFSATTTDMQCAPSTKFALSHAAEQSRTLLPAAAADSSFLRN